MAAAAATHREDALTQAAKSLLDLPGDIRNRIYHYADEGTHLCHSIQTSHAHACHSSVRCRRFWIQEVRHKLPVPTQELLESFRYFGGLAQCSRLLRHEYRPLWLRKKCVLVEPTAELDVFMGAFFPELRPGAALPVRGGVPGPREIRADEYTMLPDAKTPFNLLPLLQLSVCAPETRIRIADVYGPEELGRDCDIVGVLGRWIARELRAGRIRKVEYYVDDGYMDVAKVEYIDEEWSGGVGDIFYFRSMRDEDDDEYDDGSEDGGEDQDEGESEDDEDSGYEDDDQGASGGEEDREW